MKSFNKKAENPLKMIVTDFDGTLFSDEKTVNKKDYETLVMLGEKGIKRVIATGRSYYSATRVLADDFPIDYLVFSSGAGIMDWKNKIIEQNYSISSSMIKKAYNLLEETGFDFMLHKNIPENHYFYSVKQSESVNNDFEKRCSIYSDFSLEGGKSEILKLNTASQFVVIKPISNNENPETIHNKIKTALPGLKIIRATSPIDGKSLWIEIFPDKVSKANAAEIICGWKKIKKDNVMVIGNDYNDIDMLKWGGKNSFVVENTPEEIRNKFRLVASNNKCGFSEAVEKWLSDPAKN